MSIRVMCLAAMGVALSCAGTAFGQVTAYSFEAVASGGGPPGPDGFFGLGASVALEPVIGVTHLKNSLRYDAGVGGFVGVRTELIPPSLGNPPGVEYLLFDLNIPAIPVGLTFADIGVTIFGHDIDNSIFGVQSLFVDSQSITALGVGQHNDLRIDLDSEFFSGESFNEIYGDDPSDLDVVGAFQFHISKTVSVPLTIYIDNVRFVVPTPGTAMVCAVGAALLGARRRRNEGQR